MQQRNDIFYEFIEFEYFVNLFTAYIKKNNFQ
jgi:hypothetical protein